MKAEYLTVSEAAEKYGLSAKTLIAWIKAGSIVGIKPGQRWYYIQQTSLEDYLAVLKHRLQRAQMTDEEDIT
jgi:excisionase family DNA binding protein